MLIVYEIYIITSVIKKPMSLFLKTLLPTYALPYSSLKPYPLKPLELPSKCLPFFPSHHSLHLTLLHCLNLSHGGLKINIEQVLEVLRCSHVCVIHEPNWTVLMRPRLGLR